jgi:ABC-type histidine transport system ATPase subunit
VPAAIAQVPCRRVTLRDAMNAATSKTEEELYNDAVRVVLTHALDGLTAVQVTHEMRDKLITMVSNNVNEFVDQGLADTLAEHLNL